MDLSVITVTWNSAKHISEQIRSVVLGCAQIKHEQIIIDNGSADQTVELIQKDFTGVKLLADGQNKGFSAANNLGAKLAQGRYLLFLNPDMRVTPGSLDKMVAWMDSHPKAGLASCKLLDEHGQLNATAQPRRFPGVLDQMAIILKLPHIFPSLLNRYLLKGFNADREQEVDSVRGAFMIMRRSLYEALGWAFDPRYYIWFEDVDVCREARRLGFKVVHTPVISCVDYVGQSFKQHTSLWKQRAFSASMLAYFKKWEPWYKWVWVALARPLGLAMAFVYDKIK